MSQVQQKVYLITEQQRDALLNYLLNRPYREVANGVQFLNNAPTSILNLEVPNEQLESTAEEKESKMNGEKESTIEVVSSSREEDTVFSRT